VPGTLIFYEAPHRLAATLKDAYEILGEREAVVARELTKLHEEIRRGRLSELAAHYSNEERYSRRDRGADRSERDRTTKERAQKASLHSSISSSRTAWTIARH
jgi:16S rRNA C1402 (ribose-2'-O) methylase RsmI